jgi:hypothetical protein
VVPYPGKDHDKAGSTPFETGHADYLLSLLSRLGPGLAGWPLNLADEIFVKTCMPAAFALGVAVGMGIIAHHWMRSTLNGSISDPTGNLCQ